MTGTQGLIHSRRFWVLLIDIIVALVLYFVGKYAAVAIDDVKFVIVLLQPMFVLLVAAYTVDDLSTAKWNFEAKVLDAKVAVATANKTAL